MDSGGLVGKYKSWLRRNIIGLNLFETGAWWKEHTWAMCVPILPSLLMLVQCIVVLYKNTKLVVVLLMRSRRVVQLDLATSRPL